MAKTNGDVDVFDALLGSTLPVAGVTKVFTQSFLFKRNVRYSFEYQFTSLGTVEGDFTLEQGNSPPDNEGAADLKMVVPVGAGFLKQNVNDQKVNVIGTYIPAVTAFMRIAFDGTGANAATTVMTKFNVVTVVNA